MPTESDTNRQSDGNEVPDKPLSPRQRRAVEVLIAAPNYTEAAQRLGIHRGTLYDWLADERFKAKLDRRRKQVAEEAFGTIAQATAKAATTLRDLLDNPSPHIRHRVAKDLLDIHHKHIELSEVEGRLTAIEHRLSQE